MHFNLKQNHFKNKYTIFYSYSYLLMWKNNSWKKKEKKNTIK